MACVRMAADSGFSRWIQVSWGLQRGGARATPLCDGACDRFNPKSNAMGTSPRDCGSWCESYSVYISVYPNLWRAGDTLSRASGISLHEPVPVSWLVGTKPIPHLCGFHLLQTFFSSLVAGITLSGSPTVPYSRVVHLQVVLPYRKTAKQTQHHQCIHPTASESATPHHSFASGPSGSHLARIQSPTSL